MSLIFHVDANSAYLSWIAVALLEEGYKIDIREIPSVIAGDPDNRHGIILAKSIPAKKYKIRTGESLYEAKQKCPFLQVFPPDYDLFLGCSDAMNDILSEYTPIIQRYSIDESFLDCTQSSEIKKAPVVAAYQIKDRIKKELGFTVNVGIGNNKLCAKMAGELKKPDMVHTLWPQEVKEKLWELPVEELFMVGKATTRKLAKVNIKTIGDLAQTDKMLLKSILKSHGELIWQYANGIDNEPVTLNKDVLQKGIGNSLTLAYDLINLTALNRETLALCERVGMRLRKLKCKASLVVIHLRNNNLFSYQHQVQLHSYINTTSEIYQIAKQLIMESWKGEPIRQVGVSVSKLIREEQVQLSFFDSTNKEELETLDATVDQIRNRFGEKSIIRACFANSDGEPIQGGVNNGNYIMMGGYKS